MNKEKKLYMLRKVLGREAFNAGDEYLFFCPKHKHHKPKLSINIESDLFHCWVCGLGGHTLKPLLRLNGTTSDYNEYCEVVGDDVGIKSKKYDVPKLPEEFISLTKKSNNPHVKKAIKYLRERNISNKDILRYKLGFCLDGEYKYRIIIPSFDYMGRLNFFVGRKIYEYLGWPYKHGNFDKNIIFNDYLIDWTRPITLVEGPFDAMVAHDNAIPLQGSEFNENSQLLAKIVAHGTPTYVCLDSEEKAQKKQMKIAKLLMSYNIPTYCINVGNHGYNDVGEMNKEKFAIIKQDSKKMSELDLIKTRVSLCG